MYYTHCGRIKIVSYNARSPWQKKIHGVHHKGGTRCFITVREYERIFLFFFIRGMCFFFSLSENFLVGWASFHFSTSLMRTLCSRKYICRYNRAQKVTITNNNFICRPLNKIHNFFVTITLFFYLRRKITYFLYDGNLRSRPINTCIF